MFPWVGVGVGGVERAALVWWNLLTSHEHDFLTRHAACPVLHGHKWSEYWLCSSVESVLVLGPGCGVECVLIPFWSVANGMMIG